MNRKIYIATSWKNETEAVSMASTLRREGHEVDCFCDPSTGRLVCCPASVSHILRGMDATEYVESERGKVTFQENKRWLDWCDTCLLLLPSGRSSHLEAGYAAGQGKDLFVYGDMPKGEVDAMYGFATGMFRTSEVYDLLYALKKGLR